MIGVLHVGSRTARVFTLEEVTLLGLVAARAAAAIERSRAHAALAESERRFRATFDQAAVGMAHMSCDERLLLVNQRFCQIVGYSREELSRTTRHDLIHPDDRAESLAWAQRLYRGEIDSYSMEKRCLHRDGHVVWVAATASLVRDASGAPDYVAYVIQDVSDRRRAEQERDRLLHELTQALAVRDRFLTVASHELGGFGVGLWIAREIVVALGGTIRVESQTARGARYTVARPGRGPSRRATSS